MPRTHFAQTKTQRQAAWLSQFSDFLVTHDNRYSGRIDWDAARHLYFSGLTVADAVARYLASHPMD